MYLLLLRTMTGSEHIWVPKCSSIYLLLNVHRGGGRGEREAVGRVGARRGVVLPD